MTWIRLAPSGPVPAFCRGTTDLGRGERETRGEHRGRGERLPSGSRFVFPGILLLSLLLTAPLGAQSRPSGITIGFRASGVLGTRLVSDDIGQSLLPDTLVADRFERDTVKMTMPFAPALTLVVGVPLSLDTELQLAAGYTLGRLEVSQSGSARDAGGVALGHGLVSIRKPVRGMLGRIGVGVLWFQGGDVTAIREMRPLNPLIELGLTRSWEVGGFEMEAGLVGQAAQLASEALEVRQGPPGMYYRLGIELGGARSLGR